MFYVLFLFHSFYLYLHLFYDYFCSIFILFIYVLFLFHYFYLYRIKKFKKRLIKLNVNSNKNYILNKFKKRLIKLSVNTYKNFLLNKFEKILIKLKMHVK